VIRLGVAIVILAVVALVVRRAAKTRQAPDAVRVAARTGITRGTVAAVLEVDQRRWLVTVTGSATTVVAELDSHAQAHDAVDDDVAPPAAVERIVEPPIPTPATKAARAPRREHHARPRRTRVGLIERARRRTMRCYDPDVQAVGGETT
jgi:hypothetical protein